MNPYKKIFETFAKNKIRYLIVGGVAVNLYGYNRFTGDIDILLALEAANLGKVEKLMKKLGYVQRLPVKLIELRDGKRVEKFIREKGMTAYTFISDKKPQLDLDILVGYSLDFKKFFLKKTILKAWGLRLPVVSFGDLVKMKKKAGRDKDLIDLEALLELKGL